MSIDTPGVLPRAHWLSLVALVSSCGLAHERGAGTADDAGPGIDATTPPVDASACTLGDPATVTFAPPFGAPLDGVRVTLLGIDPDPTVNGVRLHLDTCGGTPPCVVEMIVSEVGDPLTGVTIPPGAATGRLTVTADAAVLRLSDARDCVVCGGDLLVLAGTLAPGAVPELDVSADAIVCAQGCADRRVTSLVHAGTRIVASQGAPATAAPLIATIASDYFVPCSRCDCALPDRPATGLVAAFDGVYARAP